MADATVDSCGCCREQKKRTPADLSNAPGLSTLRYRVGVHCQFKADMVEAIVHKVALEDLTTREDDDLAIALLDSWATVADVLSFYQERIVNEAYLRTATERRSVLELARTIGYELKPGVAASAPLAFMVEDADGAPLQALVDEGTKVMSVPGQNEKLQIFETVENMEAKAALNDLHPLQSVSAQMKRGRTELYLKGTATRLAPGDAILLVGKERIENTGSEHWDFRILQTVISNPEKDFTHVTWKEGIGHVVPAIEPAKHPEVYAFRLRAALFGYNAPDWKAMPDVTKLSYDPHVGAEVYPPAPPPPTNTGLTEWPHFEEIVTGKSTIHLDAVYPKIIEGSWIVLAKPNYVELYRARVVETDSSTKFTLSAKTTSIQLDTDESLSTFTRRETVVFAVTEPLELSNDPLFEPVCGNKIVLDRKVPDLKKGQKLIVLGKRMRVKIVEIRNMTVSPIDGLKENDELYVLEPPSADVEGNVIWHLLSEKGLKITVKVKPENLIPKDGKITVYSDHLHLISANNTRIKTLHSGVKGAKYILTILNPVFVDGFGNLNWNLRIEANPAESFKYRAFEGNVIDPSDRIVALPPNKNDKTISEVASIDYLSDQTETTEVTLKIPVGKTTALNNVYDLSTVHVYANVALATHGETVRETLGSGDGSQTNQQFQLKKTPLTYVSASTTSGAKSTLKVYINDIQLPEAASLYGLGPTDQNYIIRIEDNGDTHITFGDGKAATRLPSGSENITAIYRSGIGLEGEVTANKLTLLTKRPFGIRSVTNPVSASGAASPEKIEDARVNAPSTVLTLNRIVSLKDYEDFARTFSGIGKAQATAEWIGEQNFVHLLVAGADTQEIDETSELYNNLLKAMDNVRAYGQKVNVESFVAIYFNVQGTVYVDPAYLPEEVKVNVQAALQAAFAFGNRSFGQKIAYSDVIAVIQDVPGVVYVDIDKLPLPDYAQMDLKDFTVKSNMLLMINVKGINLEAKT